MTTQNNPVSGAAIAVISGAFAAGLVWLLWPSSSTPPAAVLPLPPGPPPPPSAPPSTVQGNVGLGPDTHVLWRLFVWDGSSWQLQKQEQLFIPCPPCAPWPLLVPNPNSNTPPYYYSDSWSWNGSAWSKEGCVTSFKSNWCD